MIIALSPQLKDGAKLPIAVFALIIVLITVFGLEYLEAPLYKYYLAEARAEYLCGNSLKGDQSLKIAGYLNNVIASRFYCRAAANCADSLLFKDPRTAIKFYEIAIAESEKYYGPFYWRTINTKLDMAQACGSLNKDKELEIIENGTVTARFILAKQPTDLNEQTRLSIPFAKNCLGRLGWLFRERGEYKRAKAIYLELGQAQAKFPDKQDDIYPASRHLEELHKIEFGY
ncbi:MAG TPA: hypothetical protein PKD05_03840 [Candidatus Melainabacteria bacterium]|nr:hypothetical protein [Candidatus Melainabacteria bacterium]